MGGPNSGRRPGPEAIVKRMTPQISPVIAQPGGLSFPPTMHIKDEALKRTSGDLLVDAPSDGTTYGRKDAAWAAVAAGTEVDPHFFSLSGSLPYLLLTQSGSLNYVTSETDPIFMALSGSLPYVTSEVDPKFFALSGSLPYLKLTDSGSLAYVTTETDPIFMALSGSLGYVVTETDPLFFSLSGSLPYLKLTASGSIPVGGDATGSVSSIQIDHVNIASIGTNTHATIDSQLANFQTLSGSFATHTADSSDPHGATLTQTNIILTSGSRTGDVTASGSMYIPNIVHTSGSDCAAALYPIGTLLITYTP